MDNNKEDKFSKLKIQENLIGSKKYSCPKVVNLPSWDTAKEIFASSTEQWIFRGQKDSEFELKPSLYRFNSCIGENSLEEIFLSLFKTDVFKDYQEVKACNPRTQFEWLCIKQHFGIPTRLLDWTKCPYIASWFALDPSVNNPNGSCAIWAVNKKWCKSKALSRIRSIDKYKDLSDGVDLSEDKYFQDLFLSNNKREDPYFVYPFEIPERFKEIEGFKRMKHQQGIFLCAGNDNPGFELNLCFDHHNSIPEEILNEREDYIIKFVIEAKYRQQALDDLKSKGISHSFLFDSLDQYSQYVVRSVRAIDKRSRNHLTNFSAKEEINNKFFGVNESSWKQFFEDPGQFVLKANFIQLLLESELNLSQKITLLNIWRGLNC